MHTNASTRRLEDQADRTHELYDCLHVVRTEAIILEKIKTDCPLHSRHDASSETIRLFQNSGEERVLGGVETEPDIGERRRNDSEKPSLKARSYACSKSDGKLTEYSWLFLKGIPASIWQPSCYSLNRCPIDKALFSTRSGRLTLEPPSKSWRGLRRSCANLARSSAPPPAPGHRKAVRTLKGIHLKEVPIDRRRTSMLFVHAIAGARDSLRSA